MSTADWIVFGITVFFLAVVMVIFIVGSLLSIDDDYDTWGRWR